MYHVFAWFLCRSEKAVEYSGTGVSFKLPMWVLGTKPRSSGRAENVLNHRDISPSWGKRYLIWGFRAMEFSKDARVEGKEG